MEFETAWNELGKPFPRILKMSQERKTKISNRCRDPFWRDNWKKALGLMSERNFCRGENDRGWIADVDFFLRPGTVLSLIEGKFANATPAPMNGKPQKAPLESLDAWESRRKTA